MIKHVVGKQQKVRVEQTPDIVYKYFKNHKGTLTPLRMSLLVPQSTEKKPALIYYPGGGYTEANFRKYIQIKLALAEKGFVVASAEYRVIPETFKGAMLDAKEAIAYLRENADLYHIDVNRIGVFGQSAGGYMAQMMGVTSNTPYFLPDNLSMEDVRVSAVFSMFGVSNLLTVGKNLDIQAHDWPTSPEAVWINGFSFKENTNISVQDEPEKALAASPIHYVQSGLPPFLMMHGDQDKLVSPSETDDMVQVLKNNDIDVDQVIVEGAAHGTVEWIQPEVVKIITDWFSSKLQV
ncbi:alpha/beta hydrolase [Secundilactobacillus collinoides]|uniref:alpha/beta hydrolase n=1 Tax=Secundilactobacillus collinoides TaxID=33960 RepID=UPI001F2DCA8F|nr:alpha/beta hydrolase [Secundilactobacillus collinoides]